MWKEQERHEKPNGWNASTFHRRIVLRRSPAIADLRSLVATMSHPGNIGSRATSAHVAASGATDDVDAARVFASLADACC